MEEGSEKSAGKNWVRLRKVLKDKGWSSGTKRDSNGSSVVQTFRTSLACQPAHTIPTNLDVNCCRWGNTRYIFYHGNLSFNFELGYNNESSHVEVKVCFSWRDRAAEANTVETPCMTCSTSYEWFFDSALVSLEFKGKDGSEGVTKRFHVESESGACSEHLDLTRGGGNDVASFIEPLFLAKADLESQCEGSSKVGDMVYLPHAVEVLVRIHKSKWTYRESIGNRSGVECSEDVSLTEELHMSEVLPSTPYVSPGNIAECDTKPDLKEGDVSFKVGPAGSCVELRSQRCMLSYKSPVFRKMLFEVEMKEKISSEIQLPDMDPESFQLFLECLHGYVKTLNQVWESLECCIEVLKLAHKYEVRNLIDYCTSAIISHPNSDFSVEQVLDALVLGDLCGIPDLKYRCVQWIKRNASKENMEKLAELCKSSKDNDFALGFIMAMFGQ